MNTSHKSNSHSNLWLALATSPFLVGILAARSLSQTLTDIGQASEEILRGDRLPILKFPDREEKR
ncbi:MAG: hypothetical protein MUD14_24435 [Hydrococcus sp. Prado102]|nr:hypothetical protein [Hydrococcus sp. Prado102]